MIERYSRPEMKGLWMEEAKLLRWMEVELAVTEYWARAGIMKPAEWKNFEARSRALMKKGISVEAVAKLDRELKHDVLAFTTHVAGKLGAVGRYLHYGLTSTDVVDTALALTIQRAGKLLLADLDRLVGALKKRALKHKRLATIGRTHGMWAEPTSFGLKFLGFHEEMRRSRERVARALEGVRYGKLSGAVGANAHLSVRDESAILKKLGLKRESVSTQVLPRDRLAELFAAFAILGSSIERIAVELRHLQRSEVAEVREEFSKSQKGSSAMPHKRNPVSSENLTGVARLLRGYAIPALENVALWHERDISHSSAERVILPDAFIVLDYAVDRLTRIIDGLVVDEKRVKDNLQRAGKIVYAGHLLLRLVGKGANREEAYRWVQRAAHEALDRGEDLVDLLRRNRKVTKYLDASEIEATFDPRSALRHVDEIYRAAIGGRA